jgi:hypothetical protein
MRAVKVVRSPDALALHDVWCNLYAHLSERHGIRGIATFSRESFAAQMRVPGLVAFQALTGGETAGMTLWYVQEEVAYYHLGAYSAAGYRTGASFALFRAALECFREVGLRWADLGAGAGLSPEADDGLSRFKRGWATGTRTAYLCGAILDPEAWAALTVQAVPGITTYFPAYRVGEFG